MDNSGSMTVYTHTRSIRRIKRVWVDFDGTKAKCFGTFSIICGLISVIADAVGIVYFYQNKNVNGANLFLVGWGYWCPCFFWTSGGLAISAAKEKSDRLLKAVLGMSIMSAFFALELLGSSAALLACLNNPEDYYHDGYQELHPQPMRSGNYVMIGMAAVMLLMGILEFIFAIYLCVLCGPHLCCNPVPPVDESLFRQVYETSINTDGSVTQCLVNVAAEAGAVGLENRVYNDQTDKPPAYDAPLLDTQHTESSDTSHQHDQMMLQA